MSRCTWLGVRVRVRARVRVRVRVRGIQVHGDDLGDAAREQVGRLAQVVDPVLSQELVRPRCRLVRVRVMARAGWGRGWG